MFVNDITEISYVGMTQQSQPLRQYIKQFREVETVCIVLNLSISLRVEVGFRNNSNVADTHNPINRSI